MSGSPEVLIHNNTFYNDLPDGRNGKREIGNKLDGTYFIIKTGVYRI